MRNLRLRVVIFLVHDSIASNTSALRHRGDAFRVVYAVQLGAEVWVIHGFQKKSKSGISTPKAEIDLIRQRLIRLKEML